MVHVMKPVMLRWLRWQHRCYFRTTLHHHLFHSPSSTLYTLTASLQPPLISTVVPSFHRTLHFRSHGLKSPYALDSRYSNIDDSDDPNAKKSRNEKKREARRAVRWGMELAAFSTPQIKRILRVASLEPEVFDAIMLVKRLGRDVREGKRRQFNYIGRLLRDAEPELMDGLIQATKDGDQNKFQALSGSEMWDIEDDDDEVEETEYEDEEEGSRNYINMATRWFDGLIHKDADITKEIYSVQDVDFDRQLHSKKRNRLEQQRLNDLVYVKYNRTLRFRYDMRNTLDPISLQNIDESNEWLLGRMDGESDEDNEPVFDDDDGLTWATIARASGVEESSHASRATSSRSKAQPRISKSSTLTPLQLIDEEEAGSDDTEEEDVEGYKSTDGEEDVAIDVEDDD